MELREEIKEMLCTDCYNSQQRMALLKNTDSVCNPQDMNVPNLAFLGGYLIDEKI